jgi:hypothetical protein
LFAWNQAVCETVEMSESLQSKAVSVESKKRSSVDSKGLQ